MKRYGLFWKLFFAFWSAIVLSGVGAVAFVLASGHALPPPPGDDGSHRHLMVPLISALLTSLLASLALAWYLTRPLRHLRWGLDQIAAGRFDARVQPRIGKRRDEIADLGSFLDHTAERLQQWQNARRQLLHDLSHELRSPLSRLRAALGLARSEPADVPAMLERADREAERLDGLLGDLLTLSRLEAGVTVTRPDRVDLIELLLDIAADAEFEARAMERRFAVRADGRFIATVDGDLVYRAFENVVRNAIKYSEPGTCVEVSAQAAADGDQLEVTVQDRGPGVPADMLEAIFDPFVRAQLVGERKTGFGLGLAIARRAVLAHGGDIRARPREGGGLCVTIRLPRGGPQPQAA